MLHSLSTRNPRTGKADGELTLTSEAELNRIAASARAAQDRRRSLSVEQRAEDLLSLRDVLLQHADSITAALEVDTGRRALAKREFDGVCASLAGWAALAKTLVKTEWVQGRSAPHLRHRPQYHPYPMIGVISPWNFPLTLSMIDTIPALLAGCAVIVKPSEVTSRFAAPLQAAIDKTAFAESLRFIFGDGRTGAALISHSDAICFTGSVATGRKVALACAERLIPAFLELGGKDPMIICHGANLEHAVSAALRGSVLATGQACQSIERIYVQREIHEEFATRLVKSAAACTFNWPDISRGTIGPIIFERQAEIIARQIEDARARGAHILTGGVIEHHGGGLWLAPTVIANVDHTMLIMQEETFGPVMPVMPFDTVEEAIALANDSIYGLSAAVFAPTLELAEAIGVRLNAGAVSLNDAALTSLFYEAEKHSFGASGLGGSRMGVSGFSRFLRRQALIANTGAPAPLSDFAEST